MPDLGLALYVAYLVVVFAGRALLLRAQTGSAGWHGISGPPGSASWWGGLLFAAALAGGLAAAVLGATGSVGELQALDADWVAAVGIGLYAGGLAGSIAAQRAMGASWRVGVAEAERTELVAGGPFGLARNPFFSALTTSSAGLVLVVGNGLAIGALAMLVAAVELQVRVVEEPYLLRVHGDRYRAYAARVGRFVPGLGRLNTGDTT